MIFPSCPRIIDYSKILAPAWLACTSVCFVYQILVRVLDFGPCTRFWSVYQILVRVRDFGPCKHLGQYSCGPWIIINLFTNLLFCIFICLLCRAQRPSTSLRLGEADRRTQTTFLNQLSSTDFQGGFHKILGKNVRLQ